MSININGNKGKACLNDNATFIFEEGLCSIRYNKDDVFDFYKIDKVFLIKNNNIEIKLGEKEFVNLFYNVEFTKKEL